MLKVMIFAGKKGREGRRKKGRREKREGRRKEGKKERNPQIDNGTNIIEVYLLR